MVIALVTELVQDVMHALVDAGADVRAEDEQGFTALLNAVKVKEHHHLHHHLQVQV